MADVRKDIPRRLDLHRLAWAAGFIGLPLSHYWLVAKIEPFYSSIYCFLWWSYIFVVDFIVFKLRGHSLLRDRPKEFLFLTIWSVPVWMLFEAVNLRIHNWYYVMAPWTFFGGTFFLGLAFATVLPGIFETMELFVGVIEKLAPSRRIAGPGFKLSQVNLRFQWGIGVLMLVSVLFLPNICFGLAWGFAFFLTEPICYAKRRADPNQIGRSLLGQLATGDNTRLIALLLAGFLCGGLWEAWNFGARTKWIYSVPFFDQLKLGEMPVMGFFGFPPFALECYALVNFLALPRGGRHWELTAAENRERPGFTRWGVVVSGLLLPMFLLTCTGAAIWFTVTSFDEPVDHAFRWELGPGGMAALRQRDATQAVQFLRLKERPPEIDAALYERMRRLVALSEVKGIGIKNARVLEALMITRLDQLASQDPEQLTYQLRAAGRRVRLEQVRIWVRAAKKETLRSREPRS